MKPAGAVATPRRYRKIDRSCHSQRTERGPGSRVGAAVEPCRYRSNGRKLYSRRYARLSLVCAAADFCLFQKIDRREHNGSS